jgi:hypothetical protein
VEEIGVDVYEYSSGHEIKCKNFYISLRVIPHVKKPLHVSESHQVLVVEKDYVLCELGPESQDSFIIETVCFLQGVRRNKKRINSTPPDGSTAICEINFGYDSPS